MKIPSLLDGVREGFKSATPIGKVRSNGVHYFTSCGTMLSLGRERWDIFVQLRGSFEFIL